VDTSSNAVTINLPALSGLTDGDEIRVKLRDNTNTLTIDASGAETIDGQLTLVMNTQYEAVTLVAGSTEWEII
jgi:carbon monoxide dehydrogenase subunit G